jgi:ATP-dependent DNA helicase RecG
LDYPLFRDAFPTIAQPKRRDSEALSGDEMITRNETGKWNITNLGAVLLAKKLSDFHGLKRKSIRVIFYKENTGWNGPEQEGVKGYANGFEGLIGSSMG